MSLPGPKEKRGIFYEKSLRRVFKKSPKEVFKKSPKEVLKKISEEFFIAKSLTICERNFLYRISEIFFL